MSKEEVVAMLSKRGLKGELISGVVMITVANKKDVKKANKAVKEIGYNASWGVRMEEE